MSTIARRLHLTDSFGMTSGGLLLTIISGITAVCLIGAFAGILIARSYGHTTCNNWSSETGIETKFAILNWADSGTCLAQTPDGRWVLNSKWQAFVKGDQP